MGALVRLRWRLFLIHCANRQRHYFDDKSTKCDRCLKTTIWDCSGHLGLSFDMSNSLGVQGWHKLGPDGGRFWYIHHTHVNAVKLKKTAWHLRTNDVWGPPTNCPSSWYLGLSFQLDHTIPMGALVRLRWRLFLVHYANWQKCCQTTVFWWQVD